MRKIEQELLNAIDAGRVWSKDNTRIDVALLPSRSHLLTVYLHNNAIAKIETNDRGILNLRFTLAGWNTPTTRSRINAILKHYKMPIVCMGVGTKKGVPEFRCSPTPSRSLECTPIESGKWYSVTDCGVLQTFSGLIGHAE